MIFSSYEFVFGFLPIALGVYLLALRYVGVKAALGWLFAASVFFYAWWNPSYLLILGSSIGFNFLLARNILGAEVARARVLLVIGIIGNLALLGYYKYSGFLGEVVDDVFDTSVGWPHLALPLALSFCTFQQIAFLMDTFTGRGTRGNFFEYALFITFFPHLIAGPIVHHKDLVPQIRSLGPRVASEHFRAGVALFAIGLAKKLLIADSLAEVVTPAYAAAANGEVTFAQAWIGGAGFLLQVYFDFSGYSDMALGLAKMFGFRLPMNFNSPLKATSIIAFWSRWHITLTQFLTAYVFTPLSMAAMRRRMAAPKPAGAKRKRPFDGFLGTLMVPTLITMFLSGVWHGAGYQFVVWGVLHGGFLAVNHAWRKALPTAWQRSDSYRRWSDPIGLVLTLVSASFAAIYFRAENLEIANRMAVSALGFNGLSLPEGVFDRLGPVAELLMSAGVVMDATSGSLFVRALLLCSIAGAIALLFPNALEIVRRFDPASGFKAAEAAPDVVRGPFRFEFAGGLRGALAIGALAAVGFLCLSRISVFLYWQF